MQWKRLSSRFPAITKAVLPPRFRTFAWLTTIPTGLNTVKVVSSPNPQGSAKRPPKAVPPKAVSPKAVSPKAVPPKAVPLRPTTAIHNAAKQTRSTPRKPQTKAPPPTEIDRYFTHNFPKFPYDPTRPAAEQFALLRRANDFWGSDKNGPSEKDEQERRRFNEAFRKEFTAKFGYLGKDGPKHQRQDWRYLAHVLGLDPIPRTVGEFKEAMNTIWVNIFDVLQAEKTGATVHRFAGLEELKDYSKNGWPKKIFPLDSAKGGLLEFLLKKLFGVEIILGEAATSVRQKRKD